jgi:mannose-6-phosphate isomerase-like protein (cupin superfamily)
MHITSKNEIHDPLNTPTGEVVYEIIGTTDAKGGAVQHSVAHIVIPPGRSSLAHFHKIAEETYYILRGSALMVVEEKQFPVSPGQVVLIMPGELHRIFNTGDQDLEFLAVCAPPWSPTDSYPGS